jgi:hypothetical protein
MDDKAGNTIICNPVGIMQPRLVIFVWIATRRNHASRHKPSDPARFATTR